MLTEQELTDLASARSTIRSVLDALVARTTSPASHEARAVAHQLQLASKALKDVDQIERGAYSELHAELLMDACGPVYLRARQGVLQGHITAVDTVLETCADLIHDTYPPEADDWEPPL